MATTAERNKSGNAQLTDEQRSLLEQSVAASEAILVPESAEHRECEEFAKEILASVAEVLKATEDSERISHDDLMIRINVRDS